MRPFLLKLLQFFFASEKPTENELIAYGAEQQRNRQITQATVYVSACEIHRNRKLEHVGYGFYRCACCQGDSGPHTDPLQPATPPVKLTFAPGSVRAVYLQADGGPHTRAMEAVNAVKLAEQQATGKLQRDAIKREIQEREQMRQKERQK